MTTWPKSAWAVQDIGHGAKGRRPRAGDAHLLIALAVAVPVWIALAVGIGGPLALPRGAQGWIFFLVLMPLLEEVVFRGILQGQLMRTIGSQPWCGITAANGLASLAFATSHVLAQPTGWALAVILPSLMLGDLRERLGSIWPGVAVHMVYNAGFALAVLASR